MTVDAPRPDLSQHLLDTLVDLDYAGHDGLVTVNTELDAGPEDYIWRDLNIKVGLDAAFFKDGVPLVGFTSDDTPQGLAGIRRRLWNYGSVPVLISAGVEGAHAYNAVSYSTRYESDEGQLGAITAGTHVNIASQLAEAFRRADVVSGAFAATYSAAYQRSERVDAALLNNLQYLRTTSSQRGTSLRAAIDALIGGSLTALYLTQRGILTPEYLEHISGYSDIYGLLGSGRDASRLLFEGLADHFNGDVFGPLPGLIAEIPDEVFSRVASLLLGDDLVTGQASLWPYDFRVLPTDLVSSIYEQLLEETRQVDSAYYTPRFLVNMLLDETIPWGEVALPKIIDLACGSGAFMTEAFRRFCYHEQRRVNRRLSYDELKEILKTRIFGVDINPVAARTAVFGLYLGLLEQLDPPTIWESAVLPTLLDSNVLIADAFEQHSLADERFDVVVGNPPWQSSLTNAAARFTRTHNLPVADRQLASAFLWLGAHMLNPGGTLGLVMPAKPLLHNRSERAEKFRTRVFDELDVRVLVDLSAVRRQVFRNAIAPAAIIVADAPEHEANQDLTSNNKEILYVCAHPRPLSGAVDALTIAPEEVRGVSRKQAGARPEIWSTLLWGTVRDIELLDQMRTDFPTLEKIADEHHWVRGQGYQVGGGDANDATHLHNFPIIPTASVLPLDILDTPLEPFTLPTLHRTRNADLFKAPHVLVRRTITGGRIAAALVEEDAVFPNGVIGISGPPDDRDLLATVAAVLSSSVSCYWQFMTSSSWGKERDFVELDEYISLPMPIPDAARASEFLELSRTARSDADFLDSLDEMVLELYQLDSTSRDRIRNFIKQDLPRFQGPRQRYSGPSSNEWLRRYGEVITDALHNTFQVARVTSIFSRRGNYCTVAITIGDEATSSGDAAPSQDLLVAVDIDEIVGSLRNNTNKKSTGIFALPAGFFVRHNTIYIIKTLDRDRWSRDSALEDADRIFTALAFRR